MNDVASTSRQILAQNARSFRWASWFLPPDRTDDAAIVYALCRLIDDVADAPDDDDVALVGLKQIEAELDEIRTPRPLVVAFNDVAARRKLEPDYIRELIAGVRSDRGSVRVADRDELFRYCYRVAGTVGLMMCGVLGVTDANATAHAVDLGVAMQLTNICRDVKEDAEMNRVYLPAVLLREYGITQSKLLDQTADRARLSQVVLKLLREADRYYASADLGMKFIPRRSRLAILVASRLYRGIGVKLTNKGGDAMRGRTIVNGFEKSVWVGRAVTAYFRPKTMSRFGQKSYHDATLHIPLQGLPGTNPRLLA